LTLTAEAMVDKIRKELRMFINCNQETKSKTVVRPYIIAKGKKTGPQLGFDAEEFEQPAQNNTIKLTVGENEPPRRQTRSRFGGGSAIGNGDKSVKDFLNQTLEQESLQAHQDSKIVIDFAENLSSYQASKSSPG
jgi:hypothetical protein